MQKGVFTMFISILPGNNALIYIHIHMIFCVITIQCIIMNNN